MFWDLDDHAEDQRRQRVLDGQVWRAAAQEGVEDEAFQKFMKLTP